MAKFSLSKYKDITALQDLVLKVNALLVPKADILNESMDSATWDPAVKEIVQDCEDLFITKDGVPDLQAIYISGLKIEPAVFSITGWTIAALTTNHGQIRFGHDWN